jgi:hypothetical protein
MLKIIRILSLRLRASAVVDDFFEIAAPVT